MKKRLSRVAVVLLAVLGLVAACGAAAEPRAALAPMEMEVTKVVEAYSEARDSAAAGEAAPAVRMIVWNAQISMKVKDTAAALEQVQSIAHDLQGYTVGTETWLQDEQLYARITIRVPAEQFEQAMAKLRKVGIKVNRESANSDDVTDEYVDLESRLRHLQAKEAQLLAFLEKAEDTEAVLAVYELLTATQAEIEQVKGRMAYLEKLSAMATITAELYPEEAEAPVVEEGWTPGRTLRSAARALVSTLEALFNALIWFVVYVLPVLLVIILPVVLAIWLVRRQRRKARQARGQ